MLICYCCFYSVKCSFEICVTKAIFERFSEWGTMSNWVFTVIGKINFCLECLNKVKVLFYVDPFATVFICYGKVLYTLCLVLCHLALKFIFGCIQIDCCQIAYIYFVQCQFFFFFHRDSSLFLFIYCSSQIASPPSLEILASQCFMGMQECKKQRNLLKATTVISAWHTAYSLKVFN